jgi:hypothetical protein
MFIDQPAIARRKKSQQMTAMEPAAGPSDFDFGNEGVRSPGACFSLRLFSNK